MVSLKFSTMIIPVFVSFGLAGCAGNTELFSVFDTKPVLEDDAPFGAVSFSQSTQNWQIVSDRPSRLKARSQALSGCKEKDCKVLLVFGRGVCASLSLDAAKVTTAPYVSSSTNAASAVTMARQSCSDDGGQDCKATPPICN